LVKNIIASQPWLDHYDEGVPRQLSYPHATVPHLLEYAASHSPEAVCLVYAGHQLSYAQVKEAVDRLASGLAELGIKPGDRIGLLLPNLPSFVIAYFAALKLGGIVVAINPQYTPREIAIRLNDAEIQALFALRSLVPAVKEAQAGTPLRCVIVVEETDPFPPPVEAQYIAPPLRSPSPPGGKGEDVSFRALLTGNQSTPLPSIDLQPQDWALFQYSGGTTGEPKAAMASHRNLIANVCQFRSWLVNTVDGQEVFLVAIPLYHVYGMVLGMLLAIYMRSAMVLIPNPRDLENLLASLVRNHATIYPGVPSMYHAIIQHPGVQAGEYDLSSIKACISGSAPLLVETKTRFEALTGGKLIEGYGLSEAPTATHCNPVLGENRPGSIGLPLPDVDCRIASLEDGLTELPAGEAGELLIRGPQVMLGYHHQPEATQEALRGDWLHTGDIARIDAEGYFYIVDRKKDLIKPGGLQVWPREVEEQIQIHPKVLEAGVAGIPDPHRYEAVKAWVVLKPGQAATADEIRAWCRQRLAAFKVPVEIEFVAALPKTGVGKILRRELVRQHIERKTAENAENEEKTWDKPQSPRIPQRKPMNRKPATWNNKIALVTGGSSGIGLAIARQLAQQGAGVWLVARRKELLETALKQVEAARPPANRPPNTQRCGSFSADLSDAAQAAAAVEYVCMQAGLPDLLVNAAGITQPGYVQELSLDMFRSMMAVDYFGTVYTIKALLPGMIQRGSGHIINISSMAGFIGTFGYSAYCASKYAVRGFSDVLRSELKPLGIRVSIVFPPDTDTAQLAYEAPFRPPETKVLAGNTRVMSAEAVARITLQQAARGRYTILPGIDARLIYWLQGHLGDLVYPVMDWLITRARKKMQ
jgi:long-chain acyl-CoA synthetase